MQHLAITGNYGVSREMSEAEVIELYNKTENVWPKDKWHQNRKIAIHRHVSKILYNSNNAFVLNIGSAAETYCTYDRIINLDISYQKVAQLKNAICASAQSLPFIDESFDISICVGSTINYCDAYTVISEIYRTTRTGGLVILEYNTTNSGEFIFTEKYKKLVDLQYIDYGNNEVETIKLFSNSYVKHIMKTLGLQIIEIKYINVMSSFLKKYSSPDLYIDWAQKLDPLLQYHMIGGSFSSNVMITARKMT